MHFTGFGLNDTHKNIKNIDIYDESILKWEYDDNLYYGSPISSWQNAFKFKTANIGDDIINENVTIIAQPFKDIIGNDNATSTSPDTYGLYHVNKYVKILPDKSNVVYTARQVTDFSGGSEFYNDPVAALNFIKLLALNVFGSKDAINMFRNVDKLFASYGRAVERICYVIANRFDNLAIGPTVGVDTITNTLPINLNIGQQIWHNMTSLLYPIKRRFNLSYGATITKGVFKTGHNLIVKRNNINTDARVKVRMNADNINIIVVVKHSINYTFKKNEVITIKNGDAIITITLNSVQAAMLNGKLHEPTEFPFEIGDTFHIKFTIANNDSQTTANNNDINSVEQYIDFHLQLVADI
jgi:hypothetical protein